MKKLVLITALFIANMAISQTIKDTIVSGYYICRILAKGCSVRCFFLGKA